jgi:hypothetical protein
MADYSIPHLTLKSAVGLTNQPKVDLAATTGYKDVVVGGDATYDSSKNDITKWSAGIGTQNDKPVSVVELTAYIVFVSCRARHI